MSANSKEFWDLRNKKKDYHKVVKSPMNQSSMLSHRTQKNPNLEMIQELAEVDAINKPFMDRYNDETGVPYNSV